MFQTPEIHFNETIYIQYYKCTMNSPVGFLFEKTFQSFLTIFRTKMKRKKTCSANEELFNIENVLKK